MNLSDIDILFDAQYDSEGKDPDSASKTLRAYHQLLWSKPLPNGQIMQLDNKGSYLRWNGMCFGSDSIIASFMHGRFPLKEYVETHIPNYLDFRKDYLHKTYTIGGSIIFPKFQGSMNQARGCNARICDRWDLTLECIRRYYSGEQSPLDKALAKSSEFFNLFVSFKGYVDFFLLQDCIDDNYNVKLWMDTSLFIDKPMPRNLEEYHLWIDSQLDFVSKRGQRIADYCRTNGTNINI